MTFNLEYETEIMLNIEYETIIHNVVNEALNYVDCPYEAELGVILTDNQRIREINQETREIDTPTDVLSFPMVEYGSPADFSILEAEGYEFFDPDTGELLLGDIVISVEKVTEQAELYGHSPERELAFLTAHSMLHLFGFDHMEEKERIEMEEKQEDILRNLGYTR